ncbi:GNAT family N-acetyltransferase [Bosea sp. (in: a-proteobacteria)]|jgi:hypothetical protein|uniref:GNAT family N-acetyltransferase n=1 Tax=Bosea sp. (in: a-proteobacteria) TaxID=1871050 RepID=UPI003F722CAC
MNKLIALEGFSADSVALPMGAAPGLVLAPSLHTEIRPLAACADIRAAWADLASRALEPNPFFEPEFALAAAQHLVAFRRVDVILVWQGASTAAQRRLVGLLPCFPRRGLFVAERLTGLSDLRILNGAPLLDRRLGEAALEAILTARHGRNLAQGGLVLREIDLAGPAATALLKLSGKLGLGVSQRHSTLPPARAADTTEIAALQQALARQGKVRLVEAASRIQIRDAVELVLALEASGPRARAGAAVLQDTREAGFVRVMTRSFARNGQCRIGLLMLDERPIAGAIVLGRAPHGWLYLSAQDEAYAPFEPERLLLARMRKEAPARPILQRGGAGSDGAAMGELDLAPAATRTPKHLAARARDALRRGGFRLRRAGAAG